jgi:hypothetical protein
MLPFSIIGNSSKIFNVSPLAKSVLDLANALTPIDEVSHFLMEDSRMLK